MGNNVDDIPWPKPRPRRPRPARGSSDNPQGPIVGMALVLFIGLPLAVVASLAAFIMHGYGVI